MYTVCKPVCVFTWQLLPVATGKFTAVKFEFNVINYSHVDLCLLEFPELFNSITCRKHMFRFLKQELSNSKCLYCNNEPFINVSCFSQDIKIVIENNKCQINISAVGVCQKSALHEVVGFGCGVQLQYIKLRPSGTKRERFMSFMLYFLRFQPTVRCQILKVLNQAKLFSMTNYFSPSNVIYWSGLRLKLKMYRYLAQLYGNMNGTLEIKYVFLNIRTLLFEGSFTLPCMITLRTLTQQFFCFQTSPKIIKVVGLWSLFGLR